MLGNLLLAVVAFSVCGFVSTWIFQFTADLERLTAPSVLTGIPFSVLCAALCVRPLGRATFVAALLQVGVWTGIYSLVLRLMKGTQGVGWPLLVCGVLGALGVTLALDVAGWRRPRVLRLLEIACVGLAGGWAFSLGGWAYGFIVWQGMVGTLLYARIQQSRPAV